jgi:hypothetical protein
MRRVIAFASMALLTLALLLAAGGCSKQPAQKSEQPAAGAPAPSPEQQALEQKILDQEKQLADLEQRIKDKEEVDKLRNELNRQKSELAQMKQEQAAQAAAAPVAPPAVPETAAPAPETAAAQNTGTAPATEAAPEPVERAPKPKPPLVLAEGTTLVLRLQDNLSTQRNAAGDTFEAYLEKSIKAEGEIVLPVDTRVVGRVVESVASGKVKGRARMAIELEDVEWQGRMVPVRTNRLVFEADPSTKKDALMVGGGGGLGAIIGGIAGGGKGAAIGALIGGGAGTAGVLMTKGKEVEFPAETRFQFELRKDVTLPR